MHRLAAGSPRPMKLRAGAGNPFGQKKARGLNPGLNPPVEEGGGDIGGLHVEPMNETIAWVFVQRKIRLPVHPSVVRLNRFW